MVNFFDDTDIGKIRRSVFVFASLAIAAATYDLEVIFPKSIATQADGTAISLGQPTVSALLLSILTYLIARVGIYYFSHQKSGETISRSPEEIERKAVFYEETLDRIASAIEGIRSIDPDDLEKIEAGLSKCQHTLETTRLVEVNQNLQEIKNLVETAISRDEPENQELMNAIVTTRSETVKSSLIEVGGEMDQIFDVTSRVKKQFNQNREKLTRVIKDLEASHSDIENLSELEAVKSAREYAELGKSVRQARAVRAFEASWFLPGVTLLIGALGIWACFSECWPFVPFPL